MGVFTMVVAAPALDLPWHAPPRVLATLVMGRSAVANILEFDLVPLLVGTAVLVVVTALGGLAFAALVRARARVRVLLAGVLFGLTVWAVLQYFGFPLIQPLVTEKGFPPHWYAISFGVYGLVLGLLLAARRSEDGDVTPAASAPAPGSPSAEPGRDRPMTQEERLEEWRRTRAGGS